MSDWKMFRTNIKLFHPVPERLMSAYQLRDWLASFLSVEAARPVRMWIAGCDKGSSYVLGNIKIECVDVTEEPTPPKDRLNVVARLWTGHGVELTTRNGARKFPNLDAARKAAKDLGKKGIWVSFA